MNQPPSEKERKPKLKAHCQPLDPNVAPSTCSPHGCPPWFSGIKPCRHAWVWRSQQPSQSRSLQPPSSGYNGATCGSSHMPLTTPTSREPAWPRTPTSRADLLGDPLPSTSTGSSLGLNRESCVSSLAPRLGRYLFCQDQHRWARQRIPVPERRQTREHFLSLTILLPSALLELIQFTTGSCGAQQWRSWTSEARAAQELLETDIFLLDQPKEESVFRPFPTSCAIYRPEAGAIPGGQQAVAWEATCVLSSPSRLWPSQLPKHWEDTRPYDFTGESGHSAGDKTMSLLATVFL